MATMEFLEIVEHIVSHTIADTLYLIPFLFATYVAMEWLEHKTGTRTQDAIRNAGVAGPVIGAILGVVPQCGFSAAAATLYSGRVITLGTMFAVFLSTSDEMLPIFLAEKVPGTSILLIMGTKVFIGMLAGFLIDMVMRLLRRHDDEFRIHELCADANCGCEEDCETCRQNPHLVYEHCEDCYYPDEHEHDHSHDHAHGWGAIMKSAFIHTVQVLIFILIITFILNALLETVGESALEGILGGDSFFSIAVAGLVGLIPNCAASILIAQLYIEGILGSGAMLSGLLVSAGIGLLVLVRTNRNPRQNIAIIAGLYVIGVLCGVICSNLGISFLP